MALVIRRNENSAKIKPIEDKKKKSTTYETGNGGRLTITRPAESKKSFRMTPPVTQPSALGTMVQKREEKPQTPKFGLSSPWTGLKLTGDPKEDALGISNQMKDLGLPIRRAEREQKERQAGQAAWEGYQESQKEYDRLMGLDVQGVQNDIDALTEYQADLERLYKNKRIDPTPQWTGADTFLHTGEKTDAAKEKERREKELHRVDDQLRKLQDDLVGHDRLRQIADFESVREAPDFQETSQYRSTRKSEEELEALRKANESAPLHFLMPDMGFTEYGDMDYDYINKDPDAVRSRENFDAQTGLTALGVDRSFLQELTEDEVAVFNSIYYNQSPEKAYEYVQLLSQDLTGRQRRKTEREWRAYARKHPVQSSAFTVLTSPMKGASYLGQAVDYLDDGKIDQNAAYNRFSYIPTAVRGQVAQDVEKYWVDRGHEFGGKTASFLYQTGMSMGDFLTNTAVTGGNQALSLAIMGTGAAADGTIAAKDRGLSDDQAFAIGTVAGLAEVVTEKVSLEALLKPDWEKGALVYVLKNVLAEGSEEAASDAINLFADVLIAKDKSEWARSVAAYEAEGKEPDQAFILAVKDQALAMGVDFLGGALSGGIMSGVAAGGHVVSSYGTGRTAKYRAIRPENVDMPSVPIIDLSMEDVASINGGIMPESGNYLRKTAIRRATERLGLDSSPTHAVYIEASNVTRNGDTYVLKITKDSLNKMLSGSSYEGGVVPLESVLMVENLERIANNGIYYDSAGDRQGRAQIAGYDYLKTTVYIDGQPYTVNMRVRVYDEKSGGENRLYHFTPEAIQVVKQSDDASPTGTLHERTINKSGETPSADLSIRESGDGVKGQKLQQPERISGLWTDASVPAARSMDTFGQSGQKALVAGFRKGQDAAAYYAGFANYYQAGLAGVEPEKAYAPYGQALDSAQKFAAWTAGQNDAKTYRQQELKTAKRAVSAGKDSGLSQDDYRYAAETYGAEVAKRLHQLGEKLGTGIIFADTVGKNGIANGEQLGETILLSKDMTAPVLFVAGHEVLHRLQELAPEEYIAFREAIAPELTPRAEAIMDLYENKGLSITYEKALNEAAADYAGRLMADGKLLDDFIQRNRDNRTLLEKLRDVFRALIDKLTGREKQQAQSAEARLTAALEAGAKRAGELNGKGENKTAGKTGGGKLSAKDARAVYEGKSLTEDGTIYSYDFLTSLPDMKVTMLPEVDAVRDGSQRVDNRATVDLGMKNARTMGMERDGKVFIQNSYTGRNLLVRPGAIRHGLNGGLPRRLTNARLGAVIGDVVKNAVPINSLHNKAEGVTGTYAMAAYATDSKGREFVAIVTVEQRSGDIAGIEAYDVTHAVSGRQKNTSRADTKSQGVSPSTAGIISIADFISVVNMTHKSILSSDVLSHLGTVKKQTGDYIWDTRFSLKGQEESMDSLMRAALEMAESGAFENDPVIPTEAASVQPRETAHSGTAPTELSAQETPRSAVPEGEPIGLTVRQRLTLDEVRYAGHSIKQVGMALKRMGPEAIRGVINQGLQASPDAGSHIRAQMLQKKLDAGQDATPSELGHLYDALCREPTQWGVPSGQDVDQEGLVDGKKWESDMGTITESETLDRVRRKIKGLTGKEKVIGFNELSKEYQQGFRDELAKATPEVKTALEKIYESADYVLVDGRKSYYSSGPVKNIVYIGKSATPSTFAHELFHMLDRDHKISQTLSASLIQDFVALNAVSEGNIKEYIVREYPDAFIKHGIFNEYRFDVAYRGISDILNGLLEGKEQFGFGHRPEYWAKVGTLEAEAWAQFGRVQFENDPKVLEMFSNLFPNFWRSAIIALKGLM